jgi:hypothetical protein
MEAFHKEESCHDKNVVCGSSCKSMYIQRRYYSFDGARLAFGSG